MLILWGIVGRRISLGLPGLSAYAAGSSFFGAVFTVFAIFTGVTGSAAGACGSGRMGVFKNGEGEEEGREGD